MTKNLHFEMLEQPLLDGAVSRIPVLFDETKAMPPESSALVDVAKIIAAASRQSEVTIAEFRDKVGEILIATDSAEAAFAVSDEDGFGSVKVKQDGTELFRRGQEPAKLPTELLFDMLFLWTDGDTE